MLASHTTDVYSNTSGHRHRVAAVHAYLMQHAQPDYLRSVLCELDTSNIKLVQDANRSSRRLTRSGQTSDRGPSSHKRKSHGRANGQVTSLDTFYPTLEL